MVEGDQDQSFTINGEGFPIRHVNRPSWPVSGGYPLWVRDVVWCVVLIHDTIFPAHMRAFHIIFTCWTILASMASGGGVSLTQDDSVFRMSNGELTVDIDPKTARVKSAVLGGRNLLKEGSGYWSMASSSNRTRVDGFGVSKEHKITIDPKSNGGERAEVACLFRGTGNDGAFPGNVEVRYSLGRESTTLHACAVLSHGQGDAMFRMGEARFVMKLDPGIFNHLSIDENRDRDMPSGMEWDEGETLNLKEARRLKTGKLAGTVEHKYAYSAILGDVPAYGWSGTKLPYGVWMINPSMEYIAGGPTKMELTGHLDVGSGGLPTLLNMWHGSHYGGSVMNLNRDEVWSKVIGPFAIHFNQGGSPAELWSAAVKQARIERKAWPYAWFRHDENPPLSARGGISGKIEVVALVADEKPSSAIRIGLTHVDYEASGWRTSRENIGWQRDGKYYQYWTRASSDGSFRLTGVRPGTYVLHAFADGVWGEFAKTGIVVKAGSVENLETLHWKPDGSGPTIWQIGIPDRSAAEFRNGDRFWEWGNYLRIKKDFPNGVEYVVGKSDWKKDWNICQPLDLTPDCEVMGSSVWKVRFSLDHVPDAGALLRLGLCGSREGSRLSLDLNGAELGRSEALPENGVMHRDSHRGMWMELSYIVPAALLKEGGNVLSFRLSGSVWHQGVLYDCIRMEAVETLESSIKPRQSP